MIKLVLLDVDGTLTDGGIYRGNNGEDIKKSGVNFRLRDSKYYFKNSISYFIIFT